MAARLKDLAARHEQQGFSKVMKLPEQMERVYRDGGLLTKLLRNLLQELN